MSIRADELAVLLEAEAARFTLHLPDDTAPAGVVELESLRERKPLGVGERHQGGARGGSGLIRYFPEGLEPTVRDLLTAMIVVSDNTAADLLLARIGGVAGLNPGWPYPGTRRPVWRRASSMRGATG